MWRRLLLAAGLLACATPAAAQFSGASCAQVDTGAGFWSDGTETVSIAASAGDLVVGAAGIRHATRTIASVTDSSAGSNTWDINTYNSGDTGEPLQLRAFYSRLAAGVTSVTVTLSGGAATAPSGLVVCKVTGSANPAVVDASDIEITSGVTSHSIGTSLTTTTAHNFLIAFGICSNSTSLTGDAAWTDGYISASNEFLAEYRIETSTGTTDWTFTTGAAEGCGLVALAFQGAAGGGAGGIATTRLLRGLGQ